MGLATVATAAIADEISKVLAKAKDEGWDYEKTLQAVKELLSSASESTERSQPVESVTEQQIRSTAKKVRQLA